MIALSWRHLRSQRRQLVGIALAIALSVAFLVVTQMVGSTLREGLRETVGRSYQHVDMAITLADGGRPFSAEDLTAIDAVPGVAASQPANPFGAPFSYQGTTSYFNMTREPSDGPLKEGLTLEQGAWPTTENDIVVIDSVARDARLEIGDTVVVGLGPEGRDITMVISGIWSGDGHFGPDPIDGFMSVSAWETLSKTAWVNGIFVTLEPGADLAQVQEALRHLGLPHYTQQSRSALVDGEMQDAQVELAMLNTGVTAFALLTMVVAALVVSNTFAILIAQRTRDIALLRCAGATTSQVRRLLLLEAALIGAVASVGGQLLAWLMGQGVLSAIQAAWNPSFLPSTVALPTTAPIVALVMGVVLAVVSAWFPSRTAMGIDPLIALRASQAVESPMRPSLRTGLGLLCGLVGAIILMAGIAISRTSNPGIGTVVGIGGGLVSFLGVILCASTIVPVVTRVFGQAADRIGGVPARIAATNALRNPRRTTATTVALVIGVTLVSMMTVGAASLRQTLLADVDARAPIDYHLQFIDTPTSGDRLALIADITALDGVAAVATISSVEATFTIPGDGVGTTLSIDVADPTAVAAVWRDNDLLPLEPGVMLVPAWFFDSMGIPDGQQVQMRIGGVDSTVTVRSDDRIINPITGLASLPDGAPTIPATVWLRFDPDVDRNEVVDRIFAAADARGTLLQSVDVSDYRETLESALNTMLLVVVGLLAVAVLISLIGVSNTLSLSVLERTRESALLRALGFTRNQLRLSLAVEGMLLAAVGAAIGAVLGIAYGWIGTLTLVGDTFSPEFAIPWGRLAIVAAVAIGCGVLASVLPSRRATQADPVVALADR